MKQLQDDPWSKVGQTYAEGDVRTGRVTRLADFGAFVELEPGVEALAHVSTFPPTGTPDGWKASVKPGTTAAFEVLSLDLERKRIGVAMLEEGTVRAESAQAAADRTPAGGSEAVAEAGDETPATASRPGRARREIVPGARLTGKVERHERYGMFVFLAPGRTGLVPLDETGVERESDLKKAFPIGSDLEVIVLEVEPSGRRIRLSHKAVLEAEEKSDARSYAEREDRQQAQEGFGSLADKLRDALRPRDE
jgi:small subunit ribosomal protein S1